MPNPQLEGRSVREVWVRASDGIRLHGWVLNPPTEVLGTIAYFHGNAENISTHVNSVLWLVDEGYRVSLMDYRGYGRSEGSPTLQAVHLDGIAMLDAVFALESVDPNRVVVLGQSLGGSVATYAVANSRHRDQIRLLILDSTPAGYRRIVRDKLAAFPLTWPFQYPLSLPVDDEYSAEHWIQRIGRVPVLILHGAVDPVVPVEHARILCELATGEKGIWIVRDAGHTQAFGNSELRAHLLSLLERTLDSPAAPAPPEFPH